MPDSDMSWAEDVFGEAPLSQWSLDDENTPVQEDDEDTPPNEGDKIGDACYPQGDEEVIVQHVELRDK